MMKYIAMLASLLFSLSVTAASFDCKKARTYVEKTICQVPKLSQLDELMATDYLQRMQQAKKEGDWAVSHEKSVQREWLRYERNTCKSHECIMTAYEERLEKPVTHVAKPSQPPRYAFGQFAVPMDIMVYEGEKLGWKKASITQDLSIRPMHQQYQTKTNTAVIDADLVFTNAHTCTLKGESMGWYDNHFKMAVKDRDIDCELRLYPTKRNLFMKDVGNQCRLMYCGARGSFDRFVMKRVNKK